MLAADFEPRIDLELQAPWSKTEIANGRKVFVTADTAILAALRTKYALRGHEVYAVTDGTKTYLEFRVK